MSNNPGAQQKIREILNSLDGIQRAKAPAFFYTRLRARMEKEGGKSGWPLVGFLTKPALVITITAIILLLNATAITEMWKERNTKVTANTENVQSLTSEYQLYTYTVYDENP